MQLLQCTFNGCVDSSSNFSTDPLYADAARHISMASVCRDTGVPLGTLVPSALFSTDFDGNARVTTGPGLDVGADEWVP